MEAVADFVDVSGTLEAVDVVEGVWAWPELAGEVVGGVDTESRDEVFGGVGPGSAGENVGDGVGPGSAGEAVGDVGPGSAREAVGVVGSGSAGGVVGLVDVAACSV